VFTFARSHLYELELMNETNLNIFIALVCVKDKEICCLTHSQLRRLVKLRRAKKGSAEDQTQVLVNLPKGRSFRVYVNVPDRKGLILGESLLIKRKDFPRKIFEQAP